VIARTIKSLQELETVRACWEEWQNHPNNDFEHFKLVCQLRKEVISPYVTAMECGGQLRALLVGRLEHTLFVPAIGYFKPVRIPATIVTVLYQGLLGQVDEKIVQVMVRHLWSSLASGEADAVVFHGLPDDSLLRQGLLVYGSTWFCEKNPQRSVHWEMVLPEEGKFLQQKMVSKHRTSIRKKQHELDSAFPGKSSWCWISRFTDVQGLCARIENIAARTYQRSLGAGFIDDEDHRRRYILFAERGQLRIQLLEIDGEIRAFWIGTVYQGVFHSFETGYDPDLRRYEPGTLIFIRMVDELARDGVRKLDFGLGDASYKQRFGDKCWGEATFRLFAPTTKGIALRTSMGLFSTADSFGRRLVQKAGVLDRLKTRWRRRLTPIRPPVK
jgi:hypothetical protein